MFRAATRALPAARVLQRRTMATAAPKANTGFVRLPPLKQAHTQFKTWIVDMPVDVYPLAGIVGVACSGSFYSESAHRTGWARRFEPLRSASTLPLILPGLELPLTPVIYKHLVEDSARGELRLLPDRVRNA